MKENVLLRGLRNFAADFANFTGGLLVRLVWMPKVHYAPGAERVRRPDGGALFILNHVWWLDGPMLCLLCLRRRISVAAAAEMFTGPRKIGMLALRCIPLDRSGPDLSFFRTALARLRAGGSVAIFPEGVLNPTEELLPFKQGAAMLAIQAGVPVIPVYSAGNFQPFQRVQLIFGKPIRLEQRPTAAGVQAATEQLQAEMLRLQAELENRMKPKYRARAAAFRKRFYEKSVRRKLEWPKQREKG